MFQCKRCYKKFERKNNYDRHVYGRKNKCKNITSMVEDYEMTIRQLQRDKQQMRTKLDMYEDKIEEYNNQMVELHKFAIQDKSNTNTEFSNIITTILDKCSFGNIINNTTNITNNILNINPTVAFGEERSDHISIEELLEITSLGHPKGTIKLMEEIYGHESNRGTIIVKNKKKGIFNVSDGKGGYIEKNRDDIKKITAHRIITEGQRALKHIMSSKHNKTGSIVDTHFNTNCIVIELNNKKKMVDNLVLKELVRIID